MEEKEFKILKKRQGDTTTEQLRGRSCSENNDENFAAMASSFYNRLSLPTA
jgi:hypothetical protein